MAIIGVLLAEMESAPPGNVHNMQYANTAYLRAVEQAGGIPIGLPLTVNKEILDEILPVCDGFLFPGGKDVDPKFYNQDPLPQLGAVNADADEIWIKVFQYAEKTGKPILGICRGMQLINVALGGTLYQDVTLCKTEKLLLHMQKQQKRDYPIHKVTIKTDSHIAEILGKTEVYTNSMHHQSVAECGKRLRKVAETSDGIIEAVESEDGSIIAVQWHPEELLESVPEMNQLFKDLVNRAVKFKTVKEK